MGCTAAYNWRTGFVADQLFGGRNICALLLVAKGSCQCLSIHIGQSLKGEPVGAVVSSQALDHCPYEQPRTSSCGRWRGCASCEPTQGRLYPNPASAYVVFQADATPATKAGKHLRPAGEAFRVELYDDHGKRLLQRDTTTGELRLPTTTLPAGHVRVMCGKQASSHDLLITD